MLHLTAPQWWPRQARKAIQDESPYPYIVDEVISSIKTEEKKKDSEVGWHLSIFVLKLCIFNITLKGTVQRDLRRVKSGINR